MPQAGHLTCIFVTSAIISKPFLCILVVLFSASNLANSWSQDLQRFKLLSFAIRFLSWSKSVSPVTTSLIFSGVPRFFKLIRLHLLGESQVLQFLGLILHLE